jgi:hypothetical protein
VHSMNVKVKRKSLVWIAGLVAVVGWLAPAAARDPRVVVRMDEAFEVAGQVYPSGTLSVRQLYDYNPIATLNEVELNGRSIGMLLARDDARAEVAARDQLTFRRESDGHLVLTSIGLRGERARLLTPIPGATSIAIALAPAPSGVLVASR